MGQEIDREKFLPSGEVMSLEDNANGGYDVACWDAKGNNRWLKSFYNYDIAKAEYDRWN